MHNCEQVQPGLNHDAFTALPIILHGSMVPIRAGGCSYPRHVQQLGTIASRSSQDPTMMHLLCCLYSSWKHGSNSNWWLFISQACPTAGLMICLVTASLPFKPPEMEPEPATLPPQLPALLLGMGDWTSPVWTRQFASAVTGI